MQSSNSQLIDGKTGDPIGYANYNTTYNAPSTAYVTNTTTSNYVPSTSTNYVYGTGSGAIGREYAVGGYYTTNTAVPATTIAATSSNAQVVGTTVNTGKQVIKGESRIEYVPFEKKIIEYKDQSKVQRVPKKVKKIEYRQQRKIQTIPKQVTVTDYYAVEYLRQYIPQYVPEKRIEYVQVPKKQIRYEYIPVQRQIVHYPDQALDQPTTYDTTGNTYNINPQLAPTTTTNYPNQQSPTTTYTYQQPSTTTSYQQPSGTNTSTYVSNNYTSGYPTGSSTYEYTYSSDQYAAKK